MIEMLTNSHDKLLMLKINEIIDYLNNKEYIRQVDEAWGKAQQEEINKRIEYDRQQSLKIVPYYAARLKPGEICEVPNNKELIEEANKPKWKVGDIVWFISNVSFHNQGTVISAVIEKEDHIPTGNNPNYFKTKELAEAALKEIKQLLEKYQ